VEEIVQNGAGLDLLARPALPFAAQFKSIELKKQGIESCTTKDQSKREKHHFPIVKLQKDIA
jgi:hypothetical protein